MRAEELLRTERDLALALLAATDLRTAVDVLLDTLVGLDGIDCGGAYLVDWDEQVVVGFGARNVPEAFAAAHRRFELEHPNAKLLLAGESIFTARESAPPPIRRALDALGMQAFMMLPVRQGERTLGGVNLASASLDVLQPCFRDALIALAAHLGGVFVRLEAEAELERSHQELEERIAKRTADLARSERRLKRLFEHSPVPMTLTDFETNRFIDVNQAFLELLGFERDEVIGKTSADLEIWVDREERATLRRTVHSGGPPKGVEIDLKAHGGRLIRGAISSEIIEDEGRKEVLTTMLDVTHRYRAEAERLELARTMLRAQKLESLGILAGGIAHDFNNLLMGILGNAEMALLDLDEGATRERVERVRDIAVQLAELTAQMLAYTGKGQMNAKSLDLARVVSEVRPFLEATVPKRLEIEFDIPFATQKVRGDPDQLRQVIVNLVVNAVESLDGRDGSITVRVREQDLQLEQTAAHLSGDGFDGGPMVTLEVIDDGCGMDAATVERIFDPFFTTKLTGRGLGLAAVLGIVRRHGGGLEVESSPGEGTTFRVHFPIIEDEAEPPLAKTARDDRTSTSPTVLLVDGEEYIRDVTRQMLEQLGFKVVLAGDGREALSRVEECAELDLVLMDLDMPGIDGLEARARIHDIRPELPVVLSSGYAKSDVLTGPQGGLAGFIQKPYRLATLRDVLNEALASAEEDTLSLRKPAL